MNNSIELYFKELSQNKAAIAMADQYITEILNDALASPDYDRLLSLIPYIEAGNGRLAYQCLGEHHRILHILHIISLELKYKKSLFSSGCTDRKSLLEKYMLSLFAFRRLLFRLSESSFAEAASYLCKNELSVFAVYTIIQNELIIPDYSLYEKIVDIYSDYWSNKDIQLLRSLTMPERGAANE